MRKSKRSERIASLDLPPGQWERAWVSLSNREVIGRVVLAFLASLVMCLVIRGWNPPFNYRAGYVPSRDIVARVPFHREDPVATMHAQEKAKSQVRYIYEQDDRPLKQLRAQLRNTIIELITAPTLDRVDRQIREDFQFLPSSQKTSGPDSKIPEDSKTTGDESVIPLTDKQLEEQFREFRSVFTPQENLERFEQALEKVFLPFEQRGLLSQLGQELNQDVIVVHPLHKSEPLQPYKVSEVMMGDGTAIRDSLRAQPELATVADRLFAWIKPRLKPTLTLDEAQTRAVKMDTIKNVEPVFMEYAVGQILANAQQPLESNQLELLQLEYLAAMHVRSYSQMALRAGAVVVLVFMLFLLCGIHMRFRQSGPLASLTRLIVLLLMAIATVAMARWGFANSWGEIAPLLLFGMTMAIVYRRELAILLSNVLALIIVLAIGLGLGEFILLMGVAVSAIINLGSIRTRSKLIYVGFFAGLVAAMLQINMGLIDDQPLALPLIKEAFRNALLALAAGFLTMGLLPFIEQLFGVLTDLSLLELGDVAHPLLQELVRRAPSTYNHSITVGSIAEAAAESIGARGLLVRVGAYFHDIGKMLKPDYFIENQSRDFNRHETLVPAMSTLVIIAHIKDGSDLARQHRLPQPIIDLIVQHHGTTLVEFFYDRATEQKQSDPNRTEVDESSYRYPGPKPQTKEAAVLMLADAVESASRTLVEPTPARIESLIRDIAERRLRDEQFDESGLTLRELRTIEKSMAMSLTSIYHGRIKYPERDRPGSSQS